MRLLADTSAWIDFLHKGDDTFQGLLRRNQIVTHPFIVGELACGNLRNRQEILALGHLEKPLANHDCR